MSDRKNVVPLRTAKDDPRPGKMETPGERWPGQEPGRRDTIAGALPPADVIRRCSPGYATHPTVRDGMINGWTHLKRRPAIDYVAIQHGITTEAACLLLKDMLEAGRLHAKGPDGPIDAEWWRIRSDLARRRRGSPHNRGCHGSYCRHGKCWNNCPRRQMGGDPPKCDSQDTLGDNRGTRTT